MMSSTGAIPRTKKLAFASPSVVSLHHDTQILVGQDASEPLDMKMFTISSNGVQTKVPALHASWCSPRQLIQFTAPPNGSLDVPGALDAWLEEMDFYTQDLHWMLELQHHRFWSELVYARKIHKCVTSYLSGAPRWYDNLDSGTTEEREAAVAPVLATIHRMVLLVHIRISTYKESKTCHMSPSAFGDLLYTNYIIDVCQLLDLTTLYAPANSALLYRMIDNIFTQQPRYNDDLLTVVNGIITALDNVEQRLGITDVAVPVSLNTASATLEVREARDCLLYLLDTCYTLHNLVQVYPPAALLCHKRELHIRLCGSYEQIIPLLTECFSDQLQQDEKGAPQLLLRLQQLRTTYLAVYREVLQAACVAPMAEEGASGHVVNECLEGYLHVISSCLAEKTFIADYHITYNFYTDLANFKSRCSDITSVEFLEDAVQTVLDEVGVPKDPPKTCALTNGHVGAHQQPENKLPACNSQEDSSGMTHYASSGGSTAVDAMELAQLVSSVNDVMPDLGAGFLSKCLQHYHYSSESVINALLENSLPDSLSCLDRTLATTDLPAPHFQVPSPSSPSPPPTTVAGQDKEAAYCDTYEQMLDEAKLGVLNRANIYNDDEFDVFSSSASRTIDTTRIHRGKMKKELAECDHEVNNKVRSLGLAYSERQGHSIYEDEQGNDYEYEKENKYMTEAELARLHFVPYGNYNDEYDDTYDDNEAGNMDANTEIMMPRRKMINNGRSTVFGQGALNGPLGSGSDSEGGEGAKGGGAVQPLPEEEDEEDFGRRRGLKKGIGGVKFMMDLRIHGGVLPSNRFVRERNLPASHDAQIKRNKHKRYLPRDYHRDHHKPLYVNNCKQNVQEEDHEEDHEEQNTGDCEADGPRPAFMPFCENPEVVRQRRAQTYASKDSARNRGGNRNKREAGPLPPPQPLPANGFDGQDPRTTQHDEEPTSEAGGSYRVGGGAGRGRPKTYTNKSGKSWRQGNDDEERGSKGGKWKEDTNHGHAQDPAYRRKMENKNKSRKQAAQNKFTRNN